MLGPSDIKITRKKRKEKYLAIHQVSHCRRSFVLAQQHQICSLSAAAAAQSLQSCPTLCNPIDGSPGELVLFLLYNNVLNLNFTCKIFYCVIQITYGFLNISEIAAAIIVCVHCCSVMSDSLQLHELQPTRLLCPWNSPGQNTGVIAIPFSRDSSQSRTEQVSPALPCARYRLQDFMGFT